MASTQLCAAKPSVLVPFPSGQARKNGGPVSYSFGSCTDWGVAPGRKTCTLARAALTAESPTSESVGIDADKQRTEARLRKGRAAMRAWWYTQCLAKIETELDQAESDCESAEAFARQMEMEEGRAIMRFWWLEHQLAALDPSGDPKQGLFQNLWDRFAKPGRRSRTPAARTTGPVRSVAPSGTRRPLSELHRSPSETNFAASERGTPPSENEATPFERQAALSEKLAAPLASEVLEAPESQPNSASGNESKGFENGRTLSENRTTPFEIQATLSLEQAKKVVITKESARDQARAKPLDDLIRKELEREKATRGRKAAETQAGQQRKMDAGRAAMRRWWVREREATKRALGLAPYTPVWTVVRKDGKGGPISIGKAPLVIGSDVNNMERVVSVHLPYPTVSRVHARIFGKEVAHHGVYSRDYFVVDLKSTNGVRLNGTKRLRPGDEYKLNDGDELMLGEEAATLTIKKPE